MRSESCDTPFLIVKISCSALGSAYFTGPTLTLDLVIQSSAEVMARATRVAAEGGTLADLAESIRTIDGGQHPAGVLVPHRRMP